MSLLTLIISFPTVVFTVLLALTLVYWVFVLVGALDLDALGGGHQAFDGAADGALHGATDAAIHGATDAALHGSTDAALHGGADQGLEGGGHDGADGAVDSGGEGIFGSFISALHLRRAPVTVVLTLFAAFGFLGSGLAVRTLTSSGTIGWLTGVPIFLVASFVSLLLTSVAIRPLAPVFESKNASKNSDLLGKIVVVSTGEVTPKFGQARYEDGGAGLILNVRADAAAGLKKGDQCVIVDYDAEKQTFSIEIMPDVTGPSRARIGSGRVATGAPSKPAPAAPSTPLATDADDESSASEATSGARNRETR